MVVAGGADDAVFRVQERIGALDDVTAAVMLLWREIAQRRGFLRVQIADGDAAEQRNDCVAVAVKVNGRRSIRSIYTLYFMSWYYYRSSDRI